jgi:hypothetical protein
MLRISRDIFPKILAQLVGTGVLSGPALNIRGRSDQPRRAKKWSVGPWPWPIARACRIASVV